MEINKSLRTYRIGCRNLITIDRSKWSKGEWDNEPDFFADFYSDMLIIALRSPAYGHWMGYVLLANFIGDREENKEIEYIKLEESDIDKLDVHGGITFNGDRGLRLFIELQQIDGSPVSINIESETDSIGFDCCHAYDLTPIHSSFKATVNLFRDKYGRLGSPNSYTYKNLDFVIENLKHLVDQVKELSNKKSQKTLNNNSLL